MTETIKIFLSELNVESQKPKSFSFWAMAIPVLKEVTKITQSSVETEVQKVFEVECGDRKKIPDGIYISVFDKNDNKIFGGHITQQGEITLYPIIETFQD